MEPLSYIYHREVSLKKEKTSVIALIIVFVFDFLLFPAPLLAAEDSASSTRPAEQRLYMASADNAGLYFTNSNEKDQTTDSELTRTDEFYQDFISRYNVEENNDSADLKIGRLPSSKTRKTLKTGYHPMSAYNSEAAQCDASPCTTATGFNVCKHGIEDTVAANFLPFGTKVRIPEIFGDRIFIVRDRMNSRYTDKLDIWMKNKSDALQFGVRVAKIEIVD